MSISEISKTDSFVRVRRSTLTATRKQNTPHSRCGPPWLLLLLLEHAVVVWFLAQRYDSSHPLLSPQPPAARRKTMADFDGPRGKRVLAATRLHIGDMSKAPDFTAISAFVSRFGEFVDGVAVAVGVPGAPEETALAELQALADNVREAAPAATVIPVTPWGAFTPALNALVDHAARNGYDYILFASVETACTASTISALQSHLDADAQVFVAGAALPGHAFSLGEAELSGVTCPWNTLALWRVSTLSLVGFPLVAEGLHAGVSGGVEEVSAIEAVRRVLRPGVARALLVAVPGVEWETSFDDEKRAVWCEPRVRSLLIKGRLVSAHPIH